jgi:capsid protein
MSSVLEPLQQLALYTDYELDAAKINATLAMVIRNTKGEAPSMPFGGINIDQQTLDDAAGCNTMQYKALTDMPPGMIAQVLQHGEEVVAHNTSRPNVNFGGFVDKIKSNIAATLELPPEFVDLQYQNNFSASRQAGIDLGVYIDKERSLFSTQFNSIIYSEWLTNAVLSDIVTANGYLESLTNGNFFVKNAWQQAEFIGSIRQSVDILKEARAYKLFADEGFMSREEITSRVGGGDFNVNMTKLRDENEKLANSNEPLQDIDNTVVPLTDT